MQVKIQEAKITNVSVLLNESTSRFFVTVTIVAGEQTWNLEFDLTDSISNQRLSRLLCFANATFFEELKGADIRVFNYGNQLLAFGSATQDAFVPLLKKMFVEKTRNELFQLINK